jgi:hypothetical protein
MAASHRYFLTDALWPGEGLIQIFDCSGLRVLALSRAFLRGGRVLTWSYIHFAASQCVNDAGVIVEANGDAIDWDSLPLPGKYTLMRSGKRAEVMRQSCCV